MTHIILIAFYSIASQDSVSLNQSPNEVWGASYLFVVDKLVGVVTVFEQEVKHPVVGVRSRIAQGHLTVLRFVLGVGT